MQRMPHISLQDGSIPISRLRGWVPCVARVLSAPPPRISSRDAGTGISSGYGKGSGGRARLSTATARGITTESARFQDYTYFQMHSACRSP
jgi:hypothetical protein